MTAKYDYSLPASYRANLGTAGANADRTRTVDLSAAPASRCDGECTQLVILSVSAKGGEEVSLTRSVVIMNRAGYPLAQGLVTIDWKHSMRQSKTIHLQPTGLTE
jgi:hypothetical protein